MDIWEAYKQDCLYNDDGPIDMSCGTNQQPGEFRPEIGTAIPPNWRKRYFCGYIARWGSWVVFCCSFASWVHGIVGCGSFLAALR